MTVWFGVTIADSAAPARRGRWSRVCVPTLPHMYACAHPPPLASLHLQMTTQAGLRPRLSPPPPRPWSSRLPSGPGGPSGRCRSAPRCRASFAWAARAASCRPCGCTPARPRCRDWAAGRWPTCATTTRVCRIRLDSFPLHVLPPPSPFHSHSLTRTRITAPPYPLMFVCLFVLLLHSTR